MLDETLHAAQTLSQREQAAALERTARALEAAAQYRGDDTAETTRHLSPGKRVLRVTRQPRVVHALDPGMLLQELRSEEHTSELQSQSNLVCRLLLEKKKKINIIEMYVTRSMLSEK